MAEVFDWAARATVFAVATGLTPGSRWDSEAAVSDGFTRFSLSGTGVVAGTSPTPRGRARRGREEERNLGGSVRPGYPVDQARGIQERGRFIDRLFDVHRDLDGFLVETRARAGICRACDSRGPVEAIAHLL